MWAIKREDFSVAAILQRSTHTKGTAIPWKWEITDYFTQIPWDSTMDNWKREKAKISMIVWVYSVSRKFGGKGYGTAQEEE
jgi:hypothetical protein